jgi:hypothetical protein
MPLSTLLIETEIVNGDSGAWVIDAETHKVYGHLIAKDMFGDGYIIPLESTVEDIRSCMDALRVKLPTQENVRLFQRDQAEASIGPSIPLDPQPTPKVEPSEHKGPRSSSPQYNQPRPSSGYSDLHEEYGLAKGEKRKRTSGERLWTCGLCENGPSVLAHTPQCIYCNHIYDIGGCVERGCCKTYFGKG